MNARDLRDFERDPSKFAARVKRETAERKQHKLRLRAKSYPRRQAEKADRESRKDAHRRVWQGVATRAGFRCELGCASPAIELHHLIYGVGKRRQHEAVDSCVMVCAYHHRALHQNDPEELQVVLDELGEALSPEARKAVTDRIAGREYKARRFP